MKKRLTILTCLMLVCTFMFGQSSIWGDIVKSPDGMTANAKIVVKIGGETQTSENFEVGALCRVGDEDELRAFGKIEYRFGQYMSLLTMNGTTGDVLTFKVYDKVAQIEYVSDFTWTYSVNGQLGSAGNPQVINFYTPVTGDAEVNNVVYPTLAEAYTNAEIGSTITLLRDAQGAGIVIDKNVTIDFNGYKYTFSELGVGSGSLTSNGFQILKGNNVTLKNGTLNVAEAMKAEYYILVQNYANLNVENMKLDGTYLDKWSKTDGDSYVLSNNSGNVNIVNSTIIANDEGSLAFAFDVCDKTDNGYTLPVVTLDEESTINGNVEITGGLFHNNKANITAVVRKEFAATTEGWGTISSPVGTVNHNEVDNLLNGTHDFYRYNEKTNTWENVKENDNYFTTMENGRGYLYANTEETTVTFKGTLTTEVKGLELTCTSDKLPGFHLIGNPYTHNINARNFQITSGALASGFYKVTKEGALEATTDGVIAPMESVMVQAKEATKLNILNNPTSKRGSEENALIAINVANANYSDIAYVTFGEGLGLDKINHRNENVPMVYVPVDGSNYAIAVMNEKTTEIPVSFKAMTMGTYTISVEAQDCEFTTMTLVDRLTGVETNMLMEDYSFVAKSGDNTDRFIIKLSKETLDIENDTFAYINNNMLVIDNVSSNATLQVYDVLGCPVSSHNINGSANISMESLTNGMYILRLVDGNNVRVQKVVID